MSPHYIVVLNRSQLLVYREDAAPGRSEHHCVLVEAADFPASHESYTDRDSDLAGRFPRGADNNMNIDERLPMQEEFNRRQVATIARTLETFLRRHPHIRWDYAAGPALHYAVLDKLSPELRGGMDRAVPKDLTKTPADELLNYFPVPAGGAGGR
jgi:hypothetical protein